MSISALKTNALPKIQHLWEWWISELSALAPSWWVHRRSAVPRVTLRLGTASVEIDRIALGAGETLREERPIEDHDAESWQQLNALQQDARSALELSFPDVWVETLILPKAAQTRLRAATGLHLLRHAPVDVAYLEWGFAVAAVSAEFLTVRVVMAQKARLDSLAALFDANGLALPPVYGVDGDHRIKIRDGDEGGMVERRADRRAIVVSLAILAAAPFLALASAGALTWWHDARASTLAEATRPELARANVATRNENLRLALQPIAALPSISETVEELATRLPASSHLLQAERSADRQISFQVASADNPEPLAERFEGTRYIAGLNLIDHSVSDNLTISAFSGRAR